MIKEWVYRIDLLKDATVFKTIMKVYAISGGIVSAFMFLITLEEGLMEAMKLGVMVFLILGFIFLILGTCSYYLVYVPISGRYCNVKFKITDKKADFILGPKERKRGVGIGAIALVAGLATNNFSLAGQGILATRNSMSTELKNVNKVILKESIHRITLVEKRLWTNFIYVPEEEWDFIVKHLHEKCVKAEFKSI